MTDFNWSEWREYVGDDLLGGYATLDYPRLPRESEFEEGPYTE